MIRMGVVALQGVKQLLARVETIEDKIAERDAEIARLKTLIPSQTDSYPSTKPATRKAPVQSSIHKHH
jgi:hypothetical protein